MGKKLYVGSLSYDTSEETLEGAFARFGTVESASVITDRDTGRSKGFGFVEMSTDEEAEKAKDSLNNTELDGRTITVSEARPRRDKDSRGGGGQGGGSRYGGGGGGSRSYRR